MKPAYRFFLLAAVSLWCLGIFIQWFIQFDGRIVYLLPEIHKIFSLVCHQQQSKLIHFAGSCTTMTCARCTGIYIGSLAASFFLFFRPQKQAPSLIYFLSALILMASDVILYSLNIYSYSIELAFITGFLLGSIGFSYLCAALNNLISELKD